MTELPPLAPGRIVGRDGKKYPAAWMPAGDRRYLAGYVHHLAHVERRSVRQIVAAVRDEYDIRRSVGWVAGILKDWRCDHCSGVPNCAPEQPGGAT